MQTVEILDWAVAQRTFPGERRSGDTYVVKAHPRGVLIGVIDGLGHGDEASDAAEGAADTLARHAGDPLDHLVKRCDERLRSGRGAAMTLVSVDPANHTMSWLGVGNVDALLQRGDRGRSRERVVMRSGVVGYRVPRLRASTVPIRGGDLLVLVTDGIRSGFADGSFPGSPPRKIADELLERFGKDTDDALVMVARYAGHTP